ncbi:MAG: BMP family ABC transporter substrate-binding protein, partial [Clostridium sp.]
MKKIVKSLLLVMTVFLFAGCSNSSNNQSAGSEGNNGDYSKLRVALISDTIGTEQFILQAYEALKKASETYGFKMTSIECTDTAAWEENTIAASNEGYDLIIGIGWQAADPFSAAADKFPNTKYAVIDTTASNEKVTSFGFDEAQGSYVLGVMVGTAFPNESLYGYISSFQTQATYKY